MNKTVAVIIAVVFFAWLAGACPAQETVLTYEKMQTLEKDRKVYLGGILDNGGLLLFAQDPDSGGIRLLLVSSRGSVNRRIDLPFRKIEYGVPLENGRKVMIYTSDNFSFFLVDTRRKRWNKLEGRKGSQPGFALFGGHKSWLFPRDDVIFAWGYFYDRAGEYASEWLVKLNISAGGEGFVERLVEMTHLMDQARKITPGGGNPGVMKAGGNLFVFVIQNETGGVLFGYDQKKEELFQIEQFSDIHGMDLSSDGSRCAYVITPRGGGRRVLFVYDTVRRLPALAYPGEFYNPVFDREASLLAVGSSVTALNRVVGTSIRIFPVNPGSGEEKTIQVVKPGLMVDWKFTGRNRLTIVSEKGNVYRGKF